MNEEYVCRFCSSIFDSAEEREHCEINCQLDALWHIHEDFEGPNFWSTLAMTEYYHLTVDDIDKYYDEKREDIGSGGNYI